MNPRDSRGYLQPVMVFVILMATWMIFSGLFDAFHLTLGVISCAFVTWLSSDLFFAERNDPLSHRLRQAVRMAAYILWLLWEILLANIHLLRLAFGPKENLHPQIVRRETHLATDFEKFLFANSITLTPGTVTIKILGDTFYIHAISDLTARGLLDGEMERRIAAIFADGANREPTSADAS